MIDLNSISIPTGFYREEIRCDYLITRKRKEVWAVELDLLAKFQEVCEKKGLNYYADWGTLLGAIRHSGFIPWDDDIDVVMPRRDYQLLCELAGDYFSYPYFFQTEYTDCGSVRGHAQLRNSKTTAILKHEYEKKCRFNQGIFIDIFPLDNMPPASERETFWDEIKNLYRQSILHADNDLINHTHTYNNYYEEFERSIQKYNGITNPKMFGSISFSFDNPRGYRRTIDYSSWKLMKFENTKIRVPVGYNNILRVCYGIWKEMEKASSFHGEVYFDTSNPYIDYIDNRRLICKDMQLYASCE